MDPKEPKSVTEVRSFLGLANFSSRFTSNFATLTKRLHKLTKKDIHFSFDDEQRNLFEDLKEIMTQTFMLVYFNKDAETKMNADTSLVGLGAVLLQKQKKMWIQDIMQVEA